MDEVFETKRDTVIYLRWQSVVKQDKKPKSCYLSSAVLFAILHILAVLLSYVTKEVFLANKKKFFKPKDSTHA